MASDITFIHPDYKLHENQVEIVQDVAYGIDTAKAYLTQLNNETDERFYQRKENAILSNYVERIIKTTSGKIMRKPLMFEEVPDAIVEDMNDVTNENDSLDQFTKDVIEAGLKDGKAYVLVDAPMNGGNPYMTRTGRNQLTNWRKDEDGNYTMVVIMETYKEEDGKYGFEYKKQYREIDAMGNVLIWRQSGENKSSDWFIAEEINTSYNFCPFYELEVDEVPPLYDIAKENLLHMNLSSLRYRATVAYSDPFLAFYGMGVEPTGDADNPPLVIGVNQVMLTDNENARIEWIELEGKNFDIVKQQLDDFEDDISQRGLTIQSETQSAKTATQAREDSSESASRLTDIAIDTQTVINQAYEAYMMIKNSGAAVGEIIVNRDFENIVMDSGLISGLNNAVTAGNLSKKTYLESLNDQEVITIDSVDEELERIEAEFIPLEPVVEVPTDVTD